VISKILPQEYAFTDRLVGNIPIIFYPATSQWLLILYFIIGTAHTNSSSLLTTTFPN